MWKFRDLPIRRKLALVIILNGSLALLLPGVAALTYVHLNYYFAAGRVLTTEWREHVQWGAGIVGVALLNAVLVGWFLAGWLRRSIAEPIAELAAAAHRVTWEQDYTARATKRGRDELGALIDSFNEMLDHAQQYAAQLLASEDRFHRERDKAQNYLDVAGVMLVLVRADETVGLVNRMGAQILGYTEAEIVGKNWFDNFLPLRTRDEVRQVFRQLIAGTYDPVEYHDNVIRTRTGGERLIHWHNILLRDDHGQIEAVLSSGEDITDRRRLEGELLQISDRERSRIGQDLHDGLCQQLVALTFICAVLERKLQAIAPAETATVAQITTGVQDAIRQARSLARVLYPVELQMGGLSMALVELAAQIRNTGAVACDADCPEPALILDQTTATHLYRIAQEALNNAAKHSQARHISVRLRGSNDRVRLEVEDDGIGLPGDWQRGTGMGVNSMRYRSRVIGGTLDIHRGPTGGTIVTCTCPLSARG